MQTPLRSVTARIFQQTVRLQRRADALTRLLAPATTSRKTSTYTPNTASARALPLPTLPEHHVESELSRRERSYKPNIPLPTSGDGIKAWVQNLEVALPLHLRVTAAQKDHAYYTGQDLAYYLLAAYNRHGQRFDLLSYLGLEQDRWQAVTWIVNRLIDEGDPYERAVSTPSSSPSLEWHTSKSWHQLTRAPFDLDEASLTIKTPSLGAFVDFSPRLPDLGWTYHKGALGMVWRALGTMILNAAQAEKHARDKLMPHVLEIIAIFHLHGIIPDAVYKPTSSSEPLALQQPPTLHLLSNQILTALSDAAWRASESSNAVRSKATGAQYDFLGNPMLGTEFRAHVQQLRPELWLELVLWSCLHGGWIEEGTSILNSPPLAATGGEWSLINWSDELLQSQDTSQPEDVSFLSLFGWRPADKKRDVEKTLSSEVVVAYIDAQINIVRLGVGERGMAASEVLASIKGLKAMLDQESLGLGTISWDAVVVRLLETGGINLLENPVLVRDAVGLVQPFARELKLANTPTMKGRSRSFIPYTFEPSAAVLGLLHGAIRTYIRLGDAAGAVGTFQELQAFTDSNKRRSIEEFFKNMSGEASSERGDSYGFASLGRRNVTEGFTSNISQLAASYPNFYPQVPNPLLASLLDQATSARAFEFGQWLLFSKDADGPLVTQHDFSDAHLAHALIRYANAVKDKKLLQDVLAQQKKTPRQRGDPQLDPLILKAFLESQIQMRRWGSVERIFNHLKERPDRVWDTETLAVLGRELIRLEASNSEADVKSRERARRLFSNLAQRFYGRSREDHALSMRGINSVLGFLSALSPEMFEYCAGVRNRTSPGAVRLSDTAFITLLEGAIHTYGSCRAMELWEQWTTPLSLSQAPPTKRFGKANDKGVPKLESLRDDEGQTYRIGELTIRVESPTARFPPYVFHSRLKATVDSVKCLIRGAAEERARMNREELESSERTYRDFTQRAVAALVSMDLEKDAVAREIAPLRL